MYIYIRFKIAPKIKRGTIVMRYDEMPLDLQKRVGEYMQTRGGLIASHIMTGGVATPLHQFLMHDTVMELERSPEYQKARMSYLEGKTPLIYVHRDGHFVAVNGLPLISGRPRLVADKSMLSKRTERRLQIRRNRYAAMGRFVEKHIPRGGK